MGTVDLDYLKQGFASLVQQAEHTTLPTFMLWLDLKVAEFKVNGFMVLDDRITGEGWLEFLNRCPRTSMAAYAGYQYYYSNPSFGPGGHAPGHADQLPSGHSNEGPHPLRLPRPGSADRSHSLRMGSLQESPELSKSNGSPRSCVQVKPEPIDLAFERLQQERERQQQERGAGGGGFVDGGPVHPRRSLSEFPLVTPESLQSLDPSRRDGLPALILGDYHPDRSIIDGPLEGRSIDYLQNNETRNKDLQPDRPAGLPPESARDREHDTSTSEDGFFKMTTNPSGHTLVSRQSANRCPVCNRIFHYYSSFNRHMKLHQGVYTHICEVCRRKFTRKEHFVRHKCHRRPNKPSRMADLDDVPGTGGAGDPLVQPPPSNSESCPREGSIPPPLIHIPATQRNTFTYDQPFNDGSPPTGPPQQHTEHHRSYDGERPVALEMSTNNKHRRKTSTPMKVESYPPSVENLVETPSSSSTADPQEAPDGQPINYSGETPGSYLQASPPDAGKSNSGEFNISRPQSSNSEPSRPSHYVGIDPPDLYGEQSLGANRRTSYSGEIASDQYPLLKRKVLEAVSVSRSLSADHYNGGEDMAVEGGGQQAPRSLDEGAEEVAMQEDRQTNFSASSSGGAGGEPLGGENQPTDLSASGTPTEQLSRGPSPPSTSNPDAPSSSVSSTGAISMTTTSNSAPGFAPFEGQVSGNQSPLYDPHSQQHTSPGHPMDTSYPRSCPSLSLNLHPHSAYVKSEPSSPAGGKQHGDINCSSCNKKFLHLSSLNRHMKLHQGIFTHACAVCGRKFTRKEHFVNHKCSRRPRNPTRVMATTEVESPHGQPQKVEFPPSMNLPKQPSPPSGSSWDVGNLGGPPVALLGHGPGMGPDGGALGLPSSPTDHHRHWKWKSKW